MNKHTVVINDCAAPTSPGIKSIRTRQTPHGAQNLRPGFSHLVEGLPTTLNDQQLDWLEILTSIYATDLACKRGEGDLDWARDIHLSISLREPSAWEPHAVAIQDIFNSLTYDRLQLQFVKDEHPAPAPRQTKKELPDIDAVALLSGGVDSFVGAAQLLGEMDRSPALISHSGGGATVRAQKALQTPLRKLKHGVPFLSLTTQKRGSTFPTPMEFSQRSRTFLFVGCAGLVAQAKGVSDVFLNENGVMAVHVPMTAARIGSLSTRTASPPVLDRMAKLLTDIFGGTAAVRNNLVGLTKPDVVAKAVALTQDKALKNTVSCWQISHTSQHCGYCAPCMIRRISFEFHGVEDCEYLTNPFDDEDALQNPVIEDNVRQLAAYVRDLDDLSDTDLELEYPEILTSGSQVSSEEVRDMHRRWGRQARQVLARHRVTSPLI